MSAISVLLLTSDAEYSRRLRNYMAERHNDIKLCIAGEPSQLGTVLTANFCSVALVDAKYIAQKLDLPENVGVVYLTDREMGETKDGNRVFCKYRSGEVIYKMILGVYSEFSGAVRHSSEGGRRLYAFLGAGGGMGSTTISAAFAKRLAASGRAVAYLSLDRYSDMSLWFDGDSSGNLSELIFAVVSGKKNTNLPAKAASLLSRDGSGVYYMNGCKNVFDYDELNEERIENVVSCIASANGFDAVVLDGAFSDIVYRSYIESRADRIFVLTANNIVANTKLKRYIGDIKVSDAREQGAGAARVERTGIIMNRDMNRSWTGSSFEGVRFAGSVPRYNDDSIKGIVNAASLLEFWETAING